MSYLNKLDQKHEAPYYFKQFYFTELLPKEQGALLSYLIAMENNPKINRLKDDPCYFECNVSGFINRKLRGWSVLEIKTAINNLVNAGYITKRIVQNNTTCIALNHKMLDRLYEQWLQMENESSSPLYVTAETTPISAETSQILG